ncbi:MAG: EAL domain-containing protein, partial [Myxococcales bacterium]|nr:EAL domain-containing protein [Myxococcales bacterium]
RDKQGRACRIAGSQADIHDERIAIEQMRHYSLHDRLTGLPNRALFVDHLNMALSRWRREPRSMFAVVLLDLDRFKTINDSLGHDLGDELLVEAADRLRGAVREIDTIARLGGDEFALLLESLESHEQALATIDRINASLAQPFVLGGRTVYSSCSVGICLSSRGYVRGDELMRDADIALYRAKATKASVVLFARPMHEHAIARLEIETEMRLAMDERSFALAYQPIVDVSSERIVGFEVLARWNHATLGAISPSKFIPIAEETGLIHELGEWVLRRACEQRVYWASQGVDPELYVSVNISSRQLLGSRFVETVQGVLDQSGVDPQSVRLELTESALIESSTRALHVLTQLRALGLCLCLDDFGTGYSSLSYLHRYPIDVLKIDRSFVSQLETAGNSVLVDTILSLGRHLEKTVVAEGVETKAQLASLRELACGFAQGFYFSHPLDADAADRALALALPPARMSARK